MDIELVKQILIVAIASSIISTATIQKIKEALKSKKWLYLTSFLVSGIIGILYTISFTKLNIFNALWVGLISWIGADACYKAFEDKIFTKFSDINDVTEIERNDKNE